MLENLRALQRGDEQVLSLQGLLKARTDLEVGLHLGDPLTRDQVLDDQYCHCAGGEVGGVVDPCRVGSVRCPRREGTALGPRWPGREPEA